MPHAEPADASAGPADATAAALEHLYAAPGHLIRRCQQIAVALFAEETSGFDLTPVQYAALVVIRAQPGIDQTRLVNLIALDRSTIGSVIGRLEAKGLVMRVPSISDRRSKRLTATPAGSRLLDAVTGAVERTQERILGPLTFSERADFMAMLARIVDVNNVYSRAPLRR